MTREETVEYAIKFFNRRLREPVLQYGERQAIHIAISALREQEERSKGCEHCREAENIYYHAGVVNALDELLYITGDDLVVDIGCRFYLAASIKFCPMCGRRLGEV